MTTHKIPILGGILGVVIIVSCIIRWFFLMYDPSQLIMGILVGLMFCGAAYVYNYMREQDENNIKINKRLDDFTKWLGKKELS